MAFASCKVVIEQYLKSDGVELRWCMHAVHLPKKVAKYSGKHAEWSSA